MNSTFFQLFSSELSQSITVYVFLIVIVLCFIKYILFKQDVESRGVQKIIGGLAVFVVALLSQDWRTQLVSLFIGGLIIASEEFMEKLVIILKSKSPDIGKNLEVTKPTKEELKEKQEADVSELKQNIEQTSKKKVKRSALLETVELSESVIGDYFRKKFGESFEMGIKFENNSKTYITDGVIHNFNQYPLAVVEIKNLRSVDSSLKSLSQTYKQIRDVIPDLPIIFCFIFDKELNHRDISRIVADSKMYENLQVAIFSFNKNKLVEILGPNLNTLINKRS